MLSIIEAAGWPIWPLLIASVLAVTLILERSFALRRSRVAPQGLLEQITAAVRQGPSNPELQQRLEAHSPLGRIFAAGLRRAGGSREAVKEAMEDAGRAQAHALSRYLPALGTIASVSPLLGLLGTVIGMVEIFGALTPAGASPAALAQGISVALYNTAMGLVVAIPSLIFYRYFKARVDGFLMDMEQQAARLAELLHGGRG